MSSARTVCGHATTRRLFLRPLGAVYFVAFASLAVQITGLVGQRGLLPAGRFLEWAHSIYGGGAYRRLPTVFWLGTGDLALQVVAWAAPCSRSCSSSAWRRSRYWGSSGWHTSRW